MKSSYVQNTTQDTVPTFFHLAAEVIKLFIDDVRVRGSENTRIQKKRHDDRRFDFYIIFQKGRFFLFAGAARRSRCIRIKFWKFLCVRLTLWRGFVFSEHRKSAQDMYAYMYMSNST